MDRRLPAAVQVEFNCSVLFARNLGRSRAKLVGEDAEVLFIVW